MNCGLISSSSNDGGSSGGGHARDGGSIGDSERILSWFYRQN